MSAVHGSSKCFCLPKGVLGARDPICLALDESFFTDSVGVILGGSLEVVVLTPVAVALTLAGAGAGALTGLRTLFAGVLALLGVAVLRCCSWRVANENFLLWTKILIATPTLRSCGESLLILRFIIASPRTFRMITAARPDLVCCQATSGEA